MTSDAPVTDVQTTRCCVVGAGPAGCVLALLLARNGVPVTLLEAHQDLDRDFRGDTIHPPTLDLLARLGLAERLHQLPHRKLDRITLVHPAGRTVLGDLRHSGLAHPYVMLLPQVQLLDLLVAAAREYPAFRLVLGANVQRLVEEGGTVAGVRYQTADGAWHEVRAALTVGGDGRHSRLRKLAGFEPIKAAPPMDVAWFRLPRRPEDERFELAGNLRIGGGHFAVVLERPNAEWQIGYVILKGTFAQVRAGGIEALRKAVAEVIPPLADRVDHLQDFHQVQILSVESSRLPTWHRPGLLLIGDAAHVMSPVGGIGINYAIMDAVAAANRLTDPLRRGTVTAADLAAVQRDREGPVRWAQRFQGFMQQNIALQALTPDRPFRVPWPLRVLLAVPGLRRLPARLLTYGVHPARLRDDLAGPAARPASGG